jgi:hypothetical protein
MKKFSEIQGEKPKAEDNSAKGMAEKLRAGSKSVKEAHKSPEKK